MLREIIAGDERVLAEPVPVIFVQSLDNSSVSIAVRPWVKAEDYFPLQWDLPERGKNCFDAEGRTIPFPQRERTFVRAQRSSITCTCFGWER